MFRPMGRYHNAKRLLNRRPPIRHGEVVGTRSTVRAAAPASLRLRCSSDRCGLVFRSAYQTRCPKCQHETDILGGVTA